MRGKLRVGVLLMSVAGVVSGGPADGVVLPSPRTDGGMALMEALRTRHSTREFSTRVLPPQVLSDLLWAAAGVSRPESGKRTAPSARDWREIDVYVALADGAYRFDPVAHALQRVVARDIRAVTGTQDFVPQVPVNLVYVANLDRMSGAAAEQQSFYAATDAGFIAQNVYLYCASAGLATVVRGSVDRQAVAAALGLGPRQQVILAQSVGYPRD